MVFWETQPKSSIGIARDASGQQKTLPTHPTTKKEQNKKTNKKEKKKILKKEWISRWQFLYASDKLLNRWDVLHPILLNKRKTKPKMKSKPQPPWQRPQHIQSHAALQHLRNEQWFSRQVVTEKHRAAAKEPSNL